MKQMLSYTFVCIEKSIMIENENIITDDKQIAKVFE